MGRFFRIYYCGHKLVVPVPTGIQVQCCVAIIVIPTVFYRQLDILDPYPYPYPWYPYPWSRYRTHTHIYGLVPIPVPVPYPYPYLYPWVCHMSYPYPSPYPWSRTHTRTRTHGLEPVPVPIPMDSFPYAYPYPWSVPTLQVCPLRKTCFKKGSRRQGSNMVSFIYTYFCRAVLQRTIKKLIRVLKS